MKRIQQWIGAVLAIVMLLTLSAIAAPSAANVISSDSIEKAIAYAYDVKNTNPGHFSGYCAAFVWRCYYSGAMIGNSSYATAREMGDALITNTDSNPPRGAFVFWYDSNGPQTLAGHVGLSLGDGNVIHAYRDVKVTSIATVNSSHYTYRGWGAPIAGYTLSTAPSVTTTTTANPSARATDIVATAKNQLGKRASDFGFKGDWCAQFVGWCSRQVGITDLVGTACNYPPDFAKYILKNKTGHVYYFQNTYSDQYDNIRLSLRDYHYADVSDLIAAQRNTFQPQPGDFICFLWMNSAKDYNWSHIGIVDTVKDGEVYYYDGNSGSNSSVNYHHRPLADMAITCYIRPNYCTHTYNASGQCTNCGEFKPNQNDNAPLDKPGVYQTTAASNIKAAPYAAAGNMTSGTLPKGTRVSVDGAVVNGLGNTFYHVTYNGVSGYISSDRLSLVKNIDSTLTINMTSYPSTLNVGSSYGLRGSVTSNYNITKVTGAIINASGQTVMSTTDTPNATSMDVRYANLNNNLVFGNLKAGTYTLKIVATDTKTSKTWSKSFTVGNPSASAAAPTPAPTSAASTLSINMTSYPTSINAGSSYGLRGSVTSNYNITKVTGAIINASGQTVMSTTDTPNATSMDVRYANLNNNLVFNRLSRGTYTMKVVATDTKTTKTWTTTFTVK